MDLPVAKTNFFEFFDELAPIKLLAYSLARCLQPAEILSYVFVHLFLSEFQGGLPGLVYQRYVVPYRIRRKARTAGADNLHDRASSIQMAGFRSMH
jgi:hypothetical protein